MDSIVSHTLPTERKTSEVDERKMAAELVEKWVSMDNLETGLKMASVMATGFFAGGGAFASYAFLPGVMSISNHSGLTSMRAVLPRCWPMPLSYVTAALASAGLYAISKMKGTADVSWLWGAGILATILPVTVVFIEPINKRIEHGEVAEEDAPKELGKWAFYHMIRTAAVSGLFAYYTYKLAKL